MRQSFSADRAAIGRSNQTHLCRRHQTRLLLYIAYHTHTHTHTHTSYADEIGEAACRPVPRRITSHHIAYLCWPMSAWLLSRCHLPCVCALCRGYFSFKSGVGKPPFPPSISLCRCQGGSGHSPPLTSSPDMFP